MLLCTVRIWVVLLAACAKFAWSQEGERQTVETVRAHVHGQIIGSCMHVCIQVTKTLLVNHALHKIAFCSSLFVSVCVKGGDRTRRHVTAYILNLHYPSNLVTDLALY